MKQYLFFLLFFWIGVNAGVFAQGNQTVYNGNTTSVVNFGGCIYNWNNDNPGIGLPASGAGNIASFKAINTGSTPVIANITATPQPTENAYVPSSDNPGTITVINTATNQVTGTITVGNDPENVLAVDGNRLYVSNTLSNTVSVVNTVQAKVIATIGVGNFPYGLALSADKSTLYVSNVNSNTVSVISTATNTVTGTIPGFSKPFAVAASPTANLLYVVNENTASVSVVNTSTGTIVKTISCGNEPWQVTVSPDGSRVYVTNNGDNTVAVINAATNTLMTTIPVDIKPEGIALSPDGTVLYVGCFGSAEVDEINTATNLVVKKLTAASPAGMTVSPDGKIIYVVDHDNPGSLSVVNASSGTSVASVPTGIYPAGYGHFVASVNCQPVKFSITVNPAITIPDQTVNNGQTTTAVNFPAGGCSYTWTNDHPEIGLPAGGAGNINAFTAVNTGTTPITATITATATAVQYAYIPGANGITVVNTSTEKVVTTINAGSSSSNVAATPDGTKVYVSDPASNSVLVINTITNTVTATIPVGNMPGGITVSRDGTKVFVGNYNDDSVSVISTATDKVTTTIYGFERPFQLRTAPVGNVLYVLNQISGVTSVVNTANNTITGTIPFVSSPWDIAISPDGKTLYIVGSVDNSIHVFDATTFAAIATIPVDLTPENITISPDGSTIYVGCFNGGDIVVISTVTNTVIKRITNQWVHALQVSADGKTLYAVNNTDPGTLSVIDVATGSIITKVATGADPNATGNFLAGVSCAQLTFTITVKATPAVIAGPLSGFINACVGAASASPQIEQFTISGNNLNSAITATAPTGFEISTSASAGFGSSVTLPPTNKAVAATILYVRSAASAPAGNATGYVTLNSFGWTPSGPGVQVTANINPLPTANVVANQSVSNGQSTTAISLTGTGKEFDWTNDTPGIGLAASGRGDISSFKAINTTSKPITATVTVTATNPGYAYVSGGGHSGVTYVINTSDHSVVATIPVGSRPYGVAIDQAHDKVYVANDSVDYVSVIDAKTNKVVDTMYVGPESVADCITPDGSTLYVGYQYGVVIINTATGKQVTKIRDQSVEEMVASPDGKFVYVANYLTDQIDIISTATNTITGHINVNRYPLALLLSADGNTLYATSRLNNGGSISVVDLITQKMVATIPIDVYTYGMSVTPDGKKLYINEIRNGVVAVADLTTNQVIKTIPVGATPAGSSIASNGSEVYVTNVDSNSISIINTGTDQVTSTISNINTAYTMGNFIYPGSNCASAPRKFTITVNPASTAPTISAGSASGSIYACLGEASASPQLEQITVSGNNLAGNINATAPSNFEISLNPASGFASALTLSPAAGTLNSTIIYVRSTAGAPAGYLSGNVVFASGGAANQTVAVSGYVKNVPSVNSIGNQTVNNGQSTTVVVPAGTGTSYTWTNDTPGIGLAASGTGNIAAFTAVNNTASPVTATITVTPKNDPFAFISNANAGNVSIVNTATDRIVGTITTGPFPFGVAASADGRVYVTDLNSNSVSVLDPTTKTVISSIPLNGAGPESIAVSPDGSKVYVIGVGTQSVYVINTATYLVTAVIKVGQNAQYISLSPDDTKLFVTNTGDFSLSVIDTKTNTVAATIPLGFAAYGLCAGIDNNTVYIADSDHDKMAVVNTGTAQIIASVPVGYMPRGVVVSPDGARVYVANSGDKTVSVINTLTNTAVTTITVGTSPLGMSVTGDGAYLYVANKDDGTVSVISTATNAVYTTIGGFSSPYAVGSFITPGTFCPGTPTTFTITVNPTITASPAINIGSVTGVINACAGTPAASPKIEQFTISGSNLKDNITLSVPSVFEISTSPTSGFGSSVTLSQTAGTVNSTVLYVRSTASAPVGTASGVVSISSVGWIPQGQGPQITETINQLPTINTVPNQVVNNGQTTTAVSFTGTGNIFTWTNDTPGIGLPAAGSGDISSFNAINTGATPIVATITATPTNAGFAYVTRDDGTVAVINTTTNQVMEGVTAGSTPAAVSVSPGSNLVYISNLNSNNISVISTTTNKVVGTILLSGAGPMGLVASNNGKWVYVADENSNQVSVINTATSAEVKTIAVGVNPYGIAISPDDSRVYVTNFTSGTVSVISTATNAVIATITVGQSPVGVVVSGDGSRAYVVNENSNNISVINTATNTVTSTIAVGQRPAGIAIGPDKNQLYVSNTTDGTVSIMSSTSGALIATVPVGTTPFGISVNGDGSLVYVANLTSQNVSVINTFSNSVVSTISTGSLSQSIGNFVINGTGCEGTPINFTITVNPTPAATPDITASTVTGTNTACQGTASVSPNIQQLAVSGTDLSGPVALTAPNNFEISLSPTTGFGATLTLTPAGGNLNNVPVYARLAATAPAGNLSGNIEGTSPGAKTIEIPVTGIVNALPTVNTVPNQTVNNGQATAAVNFTGTGNTFTWTNDTPGIGLAASGVGNIGSFNAVNTGASTVIATVTAIPSNSGAAYVPNSFDNTISVINTGNNSVETTINVGARPIGVAISPNGRKVFVTNGGDFDTPSNISVIDALSNTLITTIPFPLATTVGPLAITPDGNTLYITGSSNTITVLNANTYQTEKRIAVGLGDFGVAVSPDGLKVYVANIAENSISVISTITNTVVATIQVAVGPKDLAVTPDGKQLYVANAGSDLVSIINTATNTVSKTISGFDAPQTVAFSPNGRWAYVTNNGSNSVSVIDVTTGLLYITIPVGVKPSGVSVTPDGTQVYVTNNDSNNVFVIDAATNKVTAMVPVGNTPEAFGSFIASQNGCSGTPTTFTITVNPTPVQTTGIIVGPATGTMSACQGSASVNPNIQQFTVSGSALSAPINLTAPNNFEISLSAGGGYGTSLTLPLAGSSVNNTIIYVRLAASASPAGPISGNVSLTSQGAQTKKVPVTGTVFALPAVNPVQPLTVNSGDIVPAINFTGTGNVFNWTNNKTSIGLAATGVGSTPSFTAVNSSANPVTATVTVTASSTGFAYIANYGSKSVSVINIANNSIVTSVPVGDSPWGVAVAPGGNNVYVTNQQSNTVSVIDASSNTVTATIPVGSSPEGVALSPDGSTLYVANQQSNTVSVINTATNALIANITVGSNPNVIVVSPGGSFVYVANQLSNSVSVISAATNTVTTNVPLTANPDGITISPDGGLVYVALSDNTVSAISTSSNSVVKTYPVGASPNEICVSPDGGTIYVSNSNGSSISVINTLTGAISTWTGFSTPDGLSLGNNGSLLYVNNFSAGTVSVVNTATGSIVNTIQVGLFPGTKGNFIWQGTGCPGVPSTFTITVNPASQPPPLITASNVTGGIFACFGTAAVSPQIEQFTVSGSDLTGAINASASAGFEISLSANSGFATSLTIPQAGGAVSNTVIYVRSAANALAGHLTGNVLLTSPGASNVNAPVNGVVNSLPIAEQPSDQTVGNGTLTSAVNFSGTGNIFTWTNDNTSIGLAASGIGDIAPFIGINATSTPVKATITVTPQSVAYAYVANSISNNVSVITIATGAIAATIPVGSYPCAVAVSPDGGKVYVANQRSNSISIISATTNTVIHTIQAGSNSPVALAVSPDGQRVYVVNLNSNNVSVYSTSTYALVTSFTVGGYPVAIAVTPDGGKVYVSNSSNSISVFNTGNSTVKTINAGQSPFGLAVTPDGAKVYAAMSGDNAVAVISTTTDAIVSTIPVGSNPAGVVITPDGASVYVSNQATNNVSVIGTATDKVFTTVTVDINPLGLSVTSDGTEVYVANERSNTVSIINTASNVASRLVNVGQYPISLGNFISAGVGCSGAPVTFVITVTPTLAPTISATGSLLPLTTTYGTPSADEMFTVSGQNLTAGISVTAPAGFEISSNKSTFTPSLVIGSGGGPVSQTLYIRLAATTPVNTYAGDILISSTGAPNFKLAMPLSTVNPALLTIIADDKTKAYNAVNPPLTISYIGFVNFETPDVLTTPPAIATTATTSSPAGQYPITVGGAAASNYNISYLPGTLTILPPAVSLVIPNTFTPNGDGINDTWNIKQLELYANCSVTIFTRWGQQVYSSVGYAVPWDGSYKGAALPFGTYYYIIDLKNGITPLAGFVAIIK